MKIELQGKRALVTGANSGIGEAIALALGEAGANVAVNYVKQAEAAEAIASRIKAAGAEAFAVQADVSESEQVQQMFARLDETWGGVDILVNNAGIDGPRATSWDAELNPWRRVLDVNLFGTFYCAREALKRMVAQRSGVILNISSVHEVIAWSGYSAYCAAKAGVSMLTKTLAQEAGPHGVRVLALAPGAIQTSINQAVWSNPKSLADLLDKIPLGRMGRTEDIARMALVLVSEVASYISGTTVFVDGGMTDFPEFAHGG